MWLVFTDEDDATLLQWFTIEEAAAMYSKYTQGSYYCHASELTPYGREKVQRRLNSEKNLQRNSLLVG